MARQQINPTEQIPSNSIVRALINIATSGSALITRIFAGNGIQIGSSTGADIGTGDVTLNVAITANQQTASYTVVAADQARVLTMNSASATTISVPQATGSFANPFWLHIQNAGAGTTTITPTTSTIDGSSTLALSQYQSVILVASGGNYITLRGLSSGGGGGGITSAQSIRDALIFG